MAYEIIDWIFDDDLKRDSDYRGILQSPYRRKQDVLSQLQTLRETGISKGDKRIDSFLRKVDVFDRTEPYDISGEIGKNNDEWKESVSIRLEDTREVDDVRAIRSTFEAERGSFEEDTASEVETRINDRQQELSALPIDDRIISTQVGRIADVLDIPEDAIRDLGIRQIQRQIEQQLRERVESATSLSDLVEIESDLSIIPTKAGQRRMKAEIRNKRGELS